MNENAHNALYIYLRCWIYWWTDRQIRFYCKLTYLLYYYTKHVLVVFGCTQCFHATLLFLFHEFMDEWKRKKKPMKIYWASVVKDNKVFGSIDFPHIKYNIRAHKIHYHMCLYNYKSIKSIVWFLRPYNNIMCASACSRLFFDVGLLLYIASKIRLHR